MKTIYDRSFSPTAIKDISSYVSAFIRYCEQDIQSLSHLVDGDIEKAFYNWSTVIRGKILEQMLDGQRFGQHTDSSFDHIHIRNFNTDFCEGFVEIASRLHFDIFEPNIFTSVDKNYKTKFREVLEAEHQIQFKSYVRDVDQFDNKIEYAYENTKSIDRMINSLIVLITVISEFIPKNRMYGGHEDTSILRLMLYQTKEVVDSYMSKFAILLGGEFLKEYTIKLNKETFFVGNKKEEAFGVIRFINPYMRTPSFYKTEDSDKFVEQLWVSSQRVINA